MPAGQSSVLLIVLSVAMAMVLQPAGMKARRGTSLATRDPLLLLAPHPQLIAQQDASGVPHFEELATWLATWLTTWLIYSAIQWQVTLSSALYR